MSGWGSWEKDRCYVSEHGSHLITVWRRVQDYGDGPRVFCKNTRVRIRYDRLQAVFEASRARDRTVRIHVPPRFENEGTR